MGRGSGTYLTYHFLLAPHGIVHLFVHVEALTWLVLSSITLISLISLFFRMWPYVSVAILD